MSEVVIEPIERQPESQKKMPLAEAAKPKITSLADLDFVASSPRAVAGPRPGPIQKTADEETAAIPLVKKTANQVLSERIDKIQERITRAKSYYDYDEISKGIDALAALRREVLGEVVGENIDGCNLSMLERPRGVAASIEGHIIDNKRWLENLNSEIRGLMLIITKSEVDLAKRVKAAEQFLLKCHHNDKGKTRQLLATLQAEQAALEAEIDEAKIEEADAPINPVATDETFSIPDTETDYSAAPTVDISNNLDDFLESMTSVTYPGTTTPNAKRQAQPPMSGEIDTFEDAPPTVFEGDRPTSNGKGNGND